MDINEINSGIEELLKTNATFTSCQKLASLIICKDYITKMNDSDDVVVEYQDVLPAYTIYKEKKRAYQMQVISDEPVISSMREVCRELLEFIQTLYNNTVIYEERKIIKETMKNFEKFL